MTGLEKILAYISAEARERARQLLLEAEEDCRRMASECADRCESTRNGMKEQTLAEGEALITKTREDVERELEEKLNAVREAGVDRVFEGVRKELRSSDFGKYREFLSAWLVSALLEENQAERAEIEVCSAPLEVLMSEEDRARFGRAVTESARRSLSRRLGKTFLSRMQLSEESVPIDGGVILRCGERVQDYSLDALLTRTRTEMEERVLAILFPQ